MRVGTAGWSVPSEIRDRFGDGGTHLERYATRFDAVEINSSFHRPHRRSTYERWAASVPAAFAFAVKLPRTITHDRRLIDCRDPLLRFTDEVGGLGAKRGPILVQLPPGLAYDAEIADAFFASMADAVDGPVVCEPRHPSWFTGDADALLQRCDVARVAADPAVVSAAAEPGGWSGLAYFRLHGTPRVYWSAYGAETVARHRARAAAVASQGVAVWTIYDNTAAGAAADDALTLLDGFAVGVLGQTYREPRLGGAEAGNNLTDAR